MSIRLVGPARHARYRDAHPPRTVVVSEAEPLDRGVVVAAYAVIACVAGGVAVAATVLLWRLL